MEAGLLRRVGEDQSRLRHDQRLVGIFVLPRAFEGIAAVDDLALQIPRLARSAAQFLEAVEMRLQLLVSDAPILDRQIGGNRVLAVAFGQMRAQVQFARQRAPGDAVPVRARPADAVAHRERAPAPHRGRGLVRHMAHGQRLGRGVEHQLEAQPVFQLVADVRQREILRRHAIGAALEPDDVKPGLGQLARHDAACPAHADENRVRLFHLRGHRRCSF